MSEENSTENIQKPKRKVFLVEMAKFLWGKKAYWLLPVIVFLFLLIFLIAVGSSPVSPFVYTVF